MRARSFVGIAAAIVFGVCFIGTYALSQDKPADHAPKPAAAGHDDMMKMWMEMSAPGPHHRGLAPMVGNFKYTNKFRMSPDQEWQTTEGEYHGEMIMGGRFLATNHKGAMMGQQFEGMGVLGYDNALKKHVAGWIDNMGTGVMRSEGTCDGSCRKITFEGEMLDPMTNQLTKYKYEYNIKSNDEFEMRWWSPNPADGQMFESMMITATRVK